MASTTVTKARELTKAISYRIIDESSFSRIVELDCESCGLTEIDTVQRGEFHVWKRGVIDAHERACSALWPEA